MKKKSGSKGNSVTRIEALLRPTVEALGIIFWDVTLVKIGGSYELTVFIDKEGGVSIDDCEDVTRALNPILDREDPIDGAYMFFVSSAGLERTLSRPEHFERFMGSDVNVKLYRAMDGAKEYSGKLSSYNEESIAIDDGTKIITFASSDVASVRLNDL